jgi:hypothetical protein
MIGLPRSPEAGEDAYINLKEIMVLVVSKLYSVQTASTDFHRFSSSGPVVLQSIPFFWQAFLSAAT